MDSIDYKEKFEMHKLEKMRELAEKDNKSVGNFDGMKMSSKDRNETFSDYMEMR